MKNLITWSIHSVVIATIVLGNWYGVAEAKSLELPVIWTLIAFGFLGIFVGFEELYRGKDVSKIKVNLFTRIMFGAEVVLLAASGSFVTAWVYMVVWVLMWIRRGSDIDKLRRKVVQP